MCALCHYSCKIWILDYKRTNYESILIRTKCVFNLYYCCFYFILCLLISFEQDTYSENFLIGILGWFLVANCIDETFKHFKLSTFNLFFWISVDRWKYFKIKNHFFHTMPNELWPHIIYCTENRFARALGVRHTRWPAVSWKK